MSDDRPRSSSPGGSRPKTSGTGSGRPSNARPKGKPGTSKSRPPAGRGQAAKPGQTRRAPEGSARREADGGDGERRPRKSSTGGKPTGNKPYGGKPTGRKPSGGKPYGKPTGRKPGGAGRPPRSSSGGDRPTRPPPREPRTEAERRAAEVRARRAPRTPIDPNTERERIEQRQTERWVDEGSIRAEALAATSRAATSRPRRDAELDPEVLAQIHAAAADTRKADRLAERLTAASAALDRERYDDVRRMVAPVIRELPHFAAGHELNGLACYRTGRWREGAVSLEQARELKPDPALLPVLADCYRAMKRWTAVDATWRELREASPSHEVMAEGRIVVAGAYADRGDLKQAIELLESSHKPPKKVREYHLRQWYVLADLHDRAGDTVGAARLFKQVMAFDPDFADARDRLRALGR